MEMLLRRLPLRRRAPSLSLTRQRPLFGSVFTAATRALSGAAEGDTIYALSSAEGKAGVAVVRISGDQAESCLLALSKTERLPLPRMCVACLLAIWVSFDALAMHLKYELMGLVSA